MDHEDFMLYFHYFIIFAVLVAPFTLPTNLIRYYIPTLILIISHWYVLNGRCIISLFHDNKTKGKDAISSVFEKYNLNRYLYDLILHTLILVSFYRIGMLNIGILVSIIFLILNKIIYKQFNIRWSEDKPISDNH